MRFTILFLLTTSLLAQIPVGVRRGIDPWIDTHPYVGGFTGDNEMFTAWASNTMLPLFPNPAGVPLFGVGNDGTTVNGGCGGNIELIQLVKLAPIGIAASGGNTAFAGPATCSTMAFSSFQANGSGTWPPGTAGAMNPGGSSSSGTWKGTVMQFRNNVLLAPFYRQYSVGNGFGANSMNLSPDAAQTWINYERWNTYTLSAATCSSSVVTMTVNSTTGLSPGTMIYLHDILPSGADGYAGATGYGSKQTLTSASGVTIQYTLKDVFGNTLSCPGTNPTSGKFGILTIDGAAPTNTTGTMMWPYTQIVGPPSTYNTNAMGRLIIFSYGQDGSYPSGIEPYCDPGNGWVCAFAVDPVRTTDGTGYTYLVRFPIVARMAAAMDPTQYQVYNCSSQSPYFPGTPDSLCDPNQSGSWTTASTIAAGTNVFHTNSHGSRPSEVFMVRYFPTHKMYVAAQIIHYSQYNTRFGFSSSPHPHGPWTPIGSSECYEQDANYPTGCTPFFSLMDWGEDVQVPSPNPVTRIRIASRDHAFSAPGMWTYEFDTGQVSFINGMNRRAEFLGAAGQQGMGHRFASGPMSGVAIPRHGPGYTLDWWADFWDHGGDTNAQNAFGRPWFRDLITNGVRYFQNNFYDGASNVGPGYSHGNGLAVDGPTFAGSGYEERMESTFSDTVISANSGNASWAMYATFKPSNAGTVPIMGSGTYDSGGNPTMVSIQTGVHNVGDVCVVWGLNSNAVSICTVGGIVSTGTWYTLVAVAQAQSPGNGYPIITIYVASAGTMTKYGGLAGLSTASTGTSVGGLTKTCATHCTTTPAVASTPLFMVHYNGVGGYALGTMGDFGVYSGAPQEYVIRSIYKTVKIDWARVNRGAL